MECLFWEYIIIEGFDNVIGVLKGSYVILIKIYYCVIDGMFGIDIMNVVYMMVFDDFFVVLLWEFWVVDKIFSGVEFLVCV